MSRLIGIRAATTVAASLLLTTALAQTQDAQGYEARLDLSLGVLDEDENLRLRNDIGFSLDSATRVQTFRFSIATGLEYPDVDDEIRLADPVVELSYTRLNANAEFSLAASYVRAQIDALVIEEEDGGLQDVQNTRELINDTGFRSSARLASRLTFGKQSLIGGSVGIGLEQVSYSETDSADLNDFETRNADLTLRFTVDPRVDVRLTADSDETLSDGSGTDQQTRNLGIGADFEVDKVTTASVDIQYTEIETSLDGGSATTDSGPTFRLLVGRAVPDGEYRLNISSMITSEGDRFEGTVERSQELRLGALEWSAGLSQGNDELTGVFDLAYTRTAKSSAIGVSLGRAVQSDVFGDEYLVDQLSLNYNLAVSETGTFETDLSYRNTDFLDPDEDDIQRLSLSVGYNHMLTQDVGLVTSLSRTRTWSSPGNEVDENSMYVGVSRSISWRP